MGSSLVLGDCLEKMKELDDNSIDSIVTDPPYGLKFMGKKWDYNVPGVDVWKEAMRVLKPGGHLLSFGGSRTYHRMAVNIEDAGFEIRDQIMWVYGSGFPKSHNIGKALDKIKGTTSETSLAFAEYIKNKRKEKGVTLKEADRVVCGGTTNYSWFEGRPAGQRLPQPDEYKKIKNLLLLDGRFDEFIGEAEREVIGKHPSIKGSGSVFNVPFENGQPVITAPATPEAQKYEGWGTALKPAHEPIVVARKPLSEKTVAKNVLKWGTGGINIDQCRVTSSTSAYKDGGNSESIVPLHKLSELRHKLHTLLFSCVADKKDYPTLANGDECVQNWSLLRDYLGHCSTCLRLYDELSPLFQVDDRVSFQRLHDVLDGISRFRKEQNDSPSGQGIDHLSNLDDFHELVLSYTSYTTPNIQTTQGRFPANLIHDGGEEVMGLFPDTVSKWGKQGRSEGGALFGWDKKDARVSEKYMGDKGSAARFFFKAEYEAEDLKPTGNKGSARFLYQAKVSKKERQGSTHPTMKPIKLMRYLCRLITPPQGVVLDPFMGSGSTGIAARQEGFDFIGIELDEEYLKIAKARIYGFK